MDFLAHYAATLESCAASAKLLKVLQESELLTTDRLRASSIEIDEALLVLRRFHVPQHRRLIRGEARARGTTFS